MSKSAKPVVIKGKLKFKSSGSGAVKKSSPKITTAERVSLDAPVPDPAVGESSVEPELEQYLTESQKRHMKKKREAELKEIKNSVKTSYRERIENFNLKLSTLTEHNDIPRVSAAGNG